MLNCAVLAACSALYGSHGCVRVIMSQLCVAMQDGLQAKPMWYSCYAIKSAHTHNRSPPRACATAAMGSDAAFRHTVCACMSLSLAVQMALHAVHKL
jgi:hypothetical protein